jgi:hypothetical protein
MNWPINVIITCETGKLLGEVAQMYLFLDFMTSEIGQNRSNHHEKSERI